VKHWWEDQIFYHIYPLGYCGVLDQKNIKAQNNLQKIHDSLDHLEGLGAKAVYFGPVFDSTSHGYDTRDFYTIDPRLGSNQDFEDLCRSMKERDFKIILDGVFHHVGREFWAFRDLQEKKEKSDFVDWFSGVDFSETSPEGDPFSYDPWEGHWELVKLNLENQELRSHLFEAVQKWIRDFNIDGLRLDVAYLLSPGFLSELREVVCLQKADFFLLGEIIQGDYREWIGNRKLHSTTNYECYKGLFSSHNDRNLYEIAYSLDRQFGPEGLYKDFSLYNFLDNHDVDRIASRLAKPQWVFTSYLLLFCMPGIPSVYYGSEWGIPGERDEFSDRELRPGWDEILNGPKNTDLEKFIGKLSRIRKDQPALKYGEYQSVLVDSEIFAFSRKHDGEFIIIIINISDETRELDFPNHGYYAFTDLLNEGEKIYARAGMIHLKLFPNWGLILKPSKD